MLIQYSTHHYRTSMWKEKNPLFCWHIDYKADCNSYDRFIDANNWAYYQKLDKRIDNIVCYSNANKDPAPYGIDLLKFIDQSNKGIATGSIVAKNNHTQNFLHEKMTVKEQHAFTNVWNQYYATIAGTWAQFNKLLKLLINFNWISFPNSKLNVHGCWIHIWWVKIELLCLRQISLINPCQLHGNYLILLWKQTGWLSPALPKLSDAATTPLVSGPLTSKHLWLDEWGESIGSSDVHEPVLRRSINTKLLNINSGAGILGGLNQLFWKFPLLPHLWISDICPGLEACDTAFNNPIVVGLVTALFWWQLLLCVAGPLSWRRCVWRSNCYGFALRFWDLEW